MEKEIYNEGLAHQDVDGKGIRYFSSLNGKMQPSLTIGSCCEGQGSRFFGSLNEYLFSTLPNDGGIYIDVYAPSSIATIINGTDVNVTVQTQWPYGQAVRVTVAIQPHAKVTFDLAVRVPEWVASAVDVHVDGASTKVGQPGSYLHMKREWQAQHTLDFALPAALTAHLYTGVDQIEPFRRYCFTHGPVLLAVVGVWDDDLKVQRLPKVNPLKPEEWLQPAGDGNALHWTVLGVPGARVLPRWEITDSTTYFSVYPAFDVDLPCQK